MDRKEVIKELEKHLRHEVSDDFLDKCIVAYRTGRHGPAGLGGYAVMGYFVPFEAVLGHSITDPKHGRSWPCSEAIGLAMFFRQKTELGDSIRECLFGTKELNMS